jgi:hypothetical protein
MYLMDLICQLYGEKYYSNFWEVWISLAYTMEISGSGFNSGAIFSKQLSINILKAKTPKYGETSFFYMASYILDVIYAIRIFEV